MKKMLIYYCMFNLFAIVSVLYEIENVPNALMIAAGFTAAFQLILAVIGTFILRRFSTPFAVGFLIGLVLIMAQQNVILSISFHNLASNAANSIFANLAMTLSMIYIFFACILIQFREHVFVTPPGLNGHTNSFDSASVLSSQGSAV